MIQRCVGLWALVPVSATKAKQVILKEKEFTLEDQKGRT